MACPGEPFTISSDRELILNGHIDTSSLDPTFEPTFMRSRPRLVLRESQDDTSSLVELEARERQGSVASDWDIPANHCHTLHPRPTTAARNQLIAVAVMAFLFMVAEIIGGLLANSLALITDATHLASDLAGFLVSLFAIYMAKKPPTHRMTFGFHRAEVFGAVVSVLIIWVVTGILFFLAVQRVIHRDYNIDADMMLITAGLGVGFNIIMTVILHAGICSCQAHSTFGHGHSHSAHSHHQDHSEGTQQMQNPVSPSSPIMGHSAGSPKKAKKTRNINVRAALIHVIGDLIQSIGVLIAAYIIKYKPEYKLADPVCTFVFSVLVLFTTITVLRDAGLVLLEAVPRDVNYKQLQDDLSELGGVMSVHSLHVWSLTMDKTALAVHLAIDSEVHWQDVIDAANQMLRNKHHIKKTTIQVEKYDADIMSTCDQCRNPGN